MLFKNDGVTTSTVEVEKRNEEDTKWLVVKLIFLACIVVVLPLLLLMTGALSDNVKVETDAQPFSLIAGGLWKTFDIERDYAKFQTEHHDLKVVAMSCNGKVCYLFTEIKKEK